METSVKKMLLNVGIMLANFNSNMHIEGLWQWNQLFVCFLLQILKYMAVKEGLLSMETPQFFSQVDTSETSSLQGVIYPALFSARLLLFSKTGEFCQGIPKISSSLDTDTEVMRSGVFEYEDGEMEKVYQAVYNLTVSEIWSQACRSVSCVHFCKWRDNVYYLSISSLISTGSNPDAVGRHSILTPKGTWIWMS